MMHVLHGMGVSQCISPIGAKFWWCESDDMFKVERWLLTSEPWEILLCVAANGDLYMPSWVRSWLPFLLCVVAWEPSDESLTLKFRWSRVGDCDRCLDSIARVATRLGTDGEFLVGPPFTPPESLMQDLEGIPQAGRKARGTSAPETVYSMGSTQGLDRRRKVRTA